MLPPQLHLAGLRRLLSHRHDCQAGEQCSPEGFFGSEGQDMRKLPCREVG